LLFVKQLTDHYGLLSKQYGSLFEIQPDSEQTDPFLMLTNWLINMGHQYGLFQIQWPTHSGLKQSTMFES